MNLQNLNVKWILVGTGVLAVFVFIVWFAMSRPSAELVSTLPTSVDFGAANDRPGEAGGGGAQAEEGGTLNEPFETESSTNEKVFKIAEGPIADAILIQTTRPTTTLARYISAESGRVFDLPLDVPGALPRAVSNTTIPGIQRASLLQNGAGAILQYESDGVRKTLSLGLASATTTLSAAANPQPTRLQYLPDHIVDFALSPNGTSLTYLLPTANGVDGYIADASGTGSKKLFSLPLSQVLIHWPSQNTLLVHTKTAFGVTGAAFSVDTRSGAVTTLFFADTLSAIADRTFSRVVYQTILTTGERMTFVHDIARNTDKGLSFSPIPEKCVWGRAATSTLFCATPIAFVPPNYLDLWHAGVFSAADTIVSFDITTGESSLRSTPENEGGVPSDMIGLSLSPDEKYLSFIHKNDRTLWGVRLTK